MHSEDSKSDEFAAIRNIPEKLFDRPLVPAFSLPAPDFKRFFDELNHRKTELEIQNEQLRKNQEQLEASNKRYADLYHVLKSQVEEHTEELARAYDDLSKEMALRSSTEDALAQSAANFAAIFNSMSDAIIFMDIQKKIVLTNPSAISLFGYTADELIEKQIKLLFASEPEYEKMNRLVSINSNSARYLQEFKLRRKDGTIFPAESLITQVNDSHGKAIGFVGIHRDISIRKTSEAEKEKRFSQMYSLLRASQMIFSAKSMVELLKNIVDAARQLTDSNLGASGHVVGEDEFFVTSSIQHQARSQITTRVINSNRGGIYAELLRSGSSIRLTHEELVNHPAWRGLPEGHPQLRGLLGASLMGPNARAMGLMMVSDKKNNADYTEEDEIILMQLSFITSLGLQHIMAQAEAEKRADELQKSRDMLEQKIQERTLDLAKAIDELKNEISHRMETEEQLLSHRQKLRSLYAHLHSLREDERTRIAREIHDELGQVLTALKMDLAWTRAHIPKELNAVLEKTDANLELVDRTIQSIKRIITELRPGILDHLGLGAAIEWQLTEFKKRTGIACHVKIDPPDLSIEPTLSIALFRIFQEALTNITRHANATVVKALLTRDAHEIKLEVADNGIGISEDKLSQPKSFGLMGMRERVYQFSGNIRITGKPGSGTVLKVTIPLTGSLYDAG